MKYEIDRSAVVLSVGELCRLALTGGDLDSRNGGGKFLCERAEVGTKIHRKLQKEAGCLYEAEVSLCHTELFDGLCYEINGRADGILKTQPFLTVDEIKTVSAKAFSLPPKPLYDAQLRCYAYFLCRKESLQRICTRLTYYCIEDGRTRYLKKEYALLELEAFFHGLLSKIQYRANLLADRATVRLPSVHSGRFPYSSIRLGQDIMLKECYRDIRAGKRLFIQAPTGTGKTISSLYPAVRALGEGYCDKIFYLTAKASTRREAYRAAADIFAAGSHLRTLVLTSREQICFNEAAKCDCMGISGHCNPQDCRYAKGFYDRCPNAVRELLSSGSGFPRSSIEAMAKKHSICPYELQLELCELCDILICDYNYVFDPQAYLRRFFDPSKTIDEKYVFLIDEAHNLCDRATAMYSAAICEGELIQAIESLMKDDPLRRHLERLGAVIHGLRRLCRDTAVQDENGVEHGYYLNRRPIESIPPIIEECLHASDAWLRTHRGDPAEVAIHRLNSDCKRFSLISEYYDDRFLTFIEINGEETMLRLVCLDPSRILHACLGKAHASVLFSATMTPLEYFSDVLGGGKDAVKISLPSPFDPNRLLLASVTGISTRFEDREKSFRKLASVIAAAVSGKKGNYIVYFPSYAYMEAVYKCFSERYPSVTTVVQMRSMRQEERDRFLDAFRDDGKLRVGFCVLGGSFSEGVDLPGGRLIGSIIVGTGLPGLSNERNLLKEYYDTTRESGFDYAYTYPGFNRVLQAAGRVIRREEDCGVVVLIDDRYATPRYTSLFPEHWDRMRYARNYSELAEVVRSFWSKI